MSEHKLEQIVFDNCIDSFFKSFAAPAQQKDLVEPVRNCSPVPLSLSGSLLMYLTLPLGYSAFLLSAPHLAVSFCGVINSNTLILPLFPTYFSSVGLFLSVFHLLASHPKVKGKINFSLLFLFLKFSDFLQMDSFLLSLLFFF